MNDNLTTELSRQLHDQVDGWHAAPLTLDGVRGRARSIRRTRRIAVAGAAAVAVAAIAVPASLVGSGLDRGAPDVPPATSTPSDEADTATPLDVPYARGRTLVMTDGSTSQLPERYQGVTLVGDEAYGVRIDNQTGESTLDVLDADLQVTESIPITGSIATNADQTAIAYGVRGGELRIRWADGEVALGEFGDARPVRLLGGPDCTMGVDDCVVYYTDDQGKPRFVNNSGEGAEVFGNPMDVKDAFSGDRGTGSERPLRIATLTSIDEQEPGSCGQVVDLRAFEPVFDTCDHTLGRFSPDGSFITGLPDYLSGIGPSFASILDAGTGDELARIEPQQGYVGQLVWADDQHVLAAVYDGGSWSVVRLGADGSKETVLGPEPGNELKPPVTLVGPPA